MLMTKWGKSVDLNNPLPDYPRPQFVRDSFLNLNGKWNCAVMSAKDSNGKIIPYNEIKAVPFKFNSQINVPFSPETELSGMGRLIKPDEYLVYERKFTLPDGFNKGRVFVNFGAVDQIAVVYINGSKVGEHKGGFTPFKFEITDYITEVENQIMVYAFDYTDTNEYPRGKQKLERGGIWYSPQSGIWQTVWLESTPVKFLEKVKITPDYDKEQVSFEYFGTDEVEVLIYDGKELIADTTDKTVKIPDFKSWSPESPFLYDVVFKAHGEKIKSYFGMRKFSIGEDEKGIKRLFLNNKPYFHNGLLDQGYYPDGFLTPPSYEALESDVKFVKDCGFNMLRKHIKIEPLLWYHYCDVNGILVWQDMVNGGGKYGPEVSVIPFVNITLDDRNYKMFHRTDLEGRNIYYQQMEETVDLLYNCPCIAVWVPFNEGWGQFDSEKAYKKIKSLDSTRTIDTTSGWHDMGHSDVISKHIYFTPIKVKKGNRPYLLSEFGGLGLKLKGHTFNDKMFGYKVYFSKESLTKAYSKLFNNTIIPQIKDGLSATVYTQVTDVEDELNGLLTYDREVEKIDRDVLRKINERVKY
ncbi:MAG: glycoside hydrolase family 2 TIM barrel-domain containing protein [Eubacteriales bacterium]|nr:glycoside hydrolase family 2 TIM barrel-domain containing protein [Eubacteriales bacterium]